MNWGIITGSSRKIWCWIGYITDERCFDHFGWLTKCWPLVVGQVHISFPFLHSFECPGGCGGRGWGCLSLIEVLQFARFGQNMYDYQGEFGATTKCWEKEYQYSHGIVVSILYLTTVYQISSVVEKDWVIGLSLSGHYRFAKQVWAKLQLL